MKPYTLATLVAAAGMLVTAEIVPTLSERMYAGQYAGPVITAVERQHYGFSDVGSHGSGFEFVWQGPIRIITPALV